MSGAGTTSSSTADGATASATGDVEFAQMMIPHHKQAVEMAALAPAAGASPEVQALAAQIAAAQAPEIEQMQATLRLAPFPPRGGALVRLIEQEGGDAGDQVEQADPGREAFQHDVVRKQHEDHGGRRHAD